jgi:hypothetical protein
MSRPVIEITGFAELNEKIKLLASDRDKKREILLLLRQVARPTLQAARSFIVNSKKAHKARGKLIQPGNLKKSLGTITGKSANPTIYVGPRAKGNNNGWYGHFVHDGVNLYHKGFKRKRKKGANAAGAKSRTTGNPFMQKANAVTNSQVTAAAEQKVAAFIQRRINKLST